MCEPVSIGLAGLALSVAGTAYNAQQQAGYAKDRNAAEQQKQALSAAARDAERTRQQAFEQKAMENWAAELNKQGAGAYETQAQEGEGQALDTTQRIATGTDASASGLAPFMGGQASDVFTGDANRQVRERMADAKTRIAGIAKLAGYDRANGYTTSQSNLFNVDQALLQSGANRSLGLGRQEGQVQAPWTTAPDLGLGQNISQLGGFGLSLAGGGQQGIDQFGKSFSSWFN